MTESTLWTPPPGRHPVYVGGSLVRALKTRRGAPQKQNKNMPVSDFYLFKYNFQPESVDSAKTGTLEINQGKDVTAVRVERACKESNDVHTFRGKVEPAKEVDCVLIYNEEDGLFTLEKLDSSLSLSYAERGPSKARHQSDSPLPIPSPAASTSKIEEDDFAAELDRELLTTFGLDDNTGDPTPKASTSTKQKNVTGSSKQVSGASGKARPKLKGTSGPTLPSKQQNPVKNAQATPISPNLARSGPVTTNNSGFTSSGKAKSKANQNSDVSMIEIEEEELEFGKPARPTKRVSPQPTAANSSSKSGASSGLVLPDPGTAPTLPGAVSSSTRSNPVGEEDDKDEWDEIIGITRPSNSGGTADDGSIFGGDVVGVGNGGGGDDDDIDLAEELAREMDRELMEEGLDEQQDADGEDSVFGGDVVEEPSTSVKPTSLNQFAGGAELTFDQDFDDDYSSSDESDDD